MSKKYDSERETRVLLEEVRSGLRVVAEGHGLIIGRLDKVEGRLDKVETKLTEHDLRFDRIEGQLNQLQKQVGSVLVDHESRLRTLEAK